jgi:hypothetical protein
MVRSIIVVPRSEPVAAGIFHPTPEYKEDSDETSSGTDPSHQAHDRVSVNSQDMPKAEDAVSLQCAAPIPTCLSLDRVFISIPMSRPPTSFKRNRCWRTKAVVVKIRGMENKPSAELREYLFKLGRKGGRRRGLAWAAHLTREDRSEFAHKAVMARWGKKPTKAG